MKKIPFNYDQAYLLVNNYFALNVKKKKGKFSAQQKREITKYTNALINEGVIYWDYERNNFVQPFKFIKNGKKDYIQGIKKPLKGRFLRGTLTSAKTKGNTIIGEHFDKVFLSLDMTPLEELGDIVDNDIIEDAANNIIFMALQGHYKQLKKEDYFTVVVANGWEIGRGSVRPENYPKKVINKTIKYRGKNKSFKMRVIDKDAVFALKDKAAIRHAEGQIGRLNKANTIISRLADLILRIYNNNTKRYKLGVETIIGLYLYKFKKQRKPTKKEIKKISGKRKRK